MIYVLYFIHIVISLFLILVVLLQQGKGADLSVFGGGSSQAAFGARGAATVLHKATVFCFVGFILTTLSIGIMKSRGTSSVMSAVETGAEQSESTGASSLAGGELPPEEASEGAAALAGGSLDEEEAPAEADTPEETPSEDSEPPPEDGEE